ncbi:MAG: hypothetical protein ABSG88_26055 [Bradyrhizobium sp.]|jgi:hypothetical protein
MTSKSQFAALELMSRVKAAAARKEMEYWLAEAEEWRRLKEAPDIGAVMRSPGHAPGNADLVSAAPPCGLSA